MSLNQKNIFLFDGIGAVLSLVFTGMLLPLFSDIIGIPVWILRSLAVFPFLYALYSFACYRSSVKTKPWMLLTIILANVFYCLVTSALIFLLDSLTLWGRLLLIAEISVVLVVVSIELKVYRQVSLGN